MKLQAERALVRAVSERYPKCIREKNVPIDLEKARRQHAGYVKALEGAGVRVEWLPSLDQAPDAVFVEDTAVILGERILITRPGAEARRLEIPSVEASLTGRSPRSVTAPGTIDGGDVLHTGDRIFVGRSTRTNEVGIEALRSVAKEEGLPVTGILLRGGLHLKSACSLLEPGTIVYWPADLDPKPFARAGLTCLAVPEAHGANILALGKKILVSKAAPQTFEMLRARGHDCISVDVGEMHKGDGALTCLSLRFPAPGAFAT